tara:strand:+ start:216 stop:806 length:591 start_codon:yes stop_codon:yes gene_type:complete
MKKILTILIWSIIISNNFAQMKKGVGLTTGTQGSGIHFIGDWKLNEKIYYGFEVRYFDIKNETEIPVYNQYTGQYINVGDKALVLLPFFATARWLPFEGKIANNFSPFVQLKGGPLLAIDGNESYRKFNSRWRKAPTFTSYGAQVVIGVSFLQMGGSSISPSIGFEFLPMGRTVDDKKRYDGTTINITWTFANSRR